MDKGQHDRSTLDGEPDLALITEIAALYYLEEATQEELSRRFGMSRARVGRLLRRARETGVVDIRVQAPRTVQADLQQEFTRRFGLQRVLLALDQSDEEAQRGAVAGLVADYLNRTLASEMTVAVGMGRNVGAVADNSFAPDKRQVLFVSAIGGSLRAGEYMNSDHISRRLAARFGGESETLYAPALVADPALHAALVANDTVRRTLDRARRADIALIGVGDVSENSNMVRMGWFSPQEIVEARLSGTVGDMMGYDFIDIDGKPSNVAIQNRVIGLTITELHRIPDVVAVASESSKAAGILGALRTGAINTLATSIGNARLVLRLDDTTRATKG